MAVWTGACAGSIRRGGAALASACGLCLLLAAGAGAQRLCPEEFCRPLVEPLGHCFHLAASYGGDSKEEAVELAAQALTETIRTWRNRHGWNRVPIQVTPMLPDPRPFGRSSVPVSIMLEPDVVSEHMHMVCWQGIVLPAVCTAGARVCRAGG